MRTTGKTQRRGLKSPCRKQKRKKGKITTGVIVEISSQTAREFLLPRHYSGRTPSVSKAFGWYDSEWPLTDDHLKAVCTFGKPASPSLCVGVCGKEESDRVYELNRLCRTEDWNEPLSHFVGVCLKRLKPLDWIVVSYSDTAMNHHGYIYQATNFLYTGATTERTDKFVGGGKHSRHYKAEEQSGFRLVRSSKHRYIYFCTSSKALRKKWMQELNYPVQEYPKGDNSPDYELGDYIKPTVVRSE